MTDDSIRDLRRCKTRRGTVHHLFPHTGDRTVEALCGRSYVYEYDVPGGRAPICKMCWKRMSERERMLFEYGSC